MRGKIGTAAVVMLLVMCLVAGCAKERPLGAMEGIVPLYEGASVVDARSVEDHRENIVQFDIQASKASEDDIIEFYRNVMVERGWTLADIKRYTGDGSVFSMVKDGVGTLTIQTIIKDSENTGQIRVVLNLTKS